jgi:hypothetical protein
MKEDTPFEIAMIVLGIAAAATIIIWGLIYVGW